MTWLRLRYNDPKTSSAEDLARLLVTVTMQALKDPAAQQLGVVIVQDMRGLSIRNISPAHFKFMAGKVLPRLPIRIGRAIIFNPPFVIGRVVLPIVRAVMSAKLKARFVVINGADFNALHQYIPAEGLPAELLAMPSFRLQIQRPAVAANLAP